MEEYKDLTKYVDRLYFAALTKVGDTDTARDIAQETFLAAITAMSKGVKPKKTWNWLCAIMSNKYCDWLRNKYNKPQISFEDYPIDIPDEVIFDDCEEKLEMVRRELGYLSKIHREVMVRFYIHGHSVSKISNDLGIPQGTVKSRLDTGRKYVKEGVRGMENYVKQSYEPDVLRISFSGSSGLNNEPFSLVDENDKLTQNILLLAYAKPVLETELAKALGTPAVFIEPIVQKLVDGELMKRTEGGKVYTDFIIYTETDRKATFKRQLEIANDKFDVFWNKTETALNALRQTEYYIRQNECGRVKLELHFCVKLLMNAHMSVRNTVTGVMTYDQYPYRKDGGRWFAMGHKFLPDGDFHKDREYHNYTVSGEAACVVDNFRGTKQLIIRKYDTTMGRFPNMYLGFEYIQWLYEIMIGIPHEESFVKDHVLNATESFLQSGVLKCDTDGKLCVNLPILSLAEYRDESQLINKYEKLLADDITDVLLPVFEFGYVKLPSHLKSVPKWQQYMLCGDSVPMAVLRNAVHRGLFLNGIKHPVQAAVFVVEK